jgi:hypothetical protein
VLDEALTAGWVVFSDFSSFSVLLTFFFHPLAQRYSLPSITEIFHFHPGMSNTFSWKD